MAGPVVLVPLDGSEPTENALRHAVALLGPIKGASWRLLTVVDPGFADIPDEVREGMDLDEDDEVYEDAIAAHPALDRGSDIVTSAGLKAERIVRTGKPYNIIVEESEQADILVMHRLGTRQLSEKLRGSLTEKITRNVTCHVMLLNDAKPVD